MKKTYLSNPAPGENLLSGNLVKETGCSWLGQAARLAGLGLAAQLAPAICVLTRKKKKEEEEEEERRRKKEEEEERY